MNMRVLLSTICLTIILGVGGFFWFVTRDFGAMILGSMLGLLGVSAVIRVEKLIFWE